MQIGDADVDLEEEEEEKKDRLGQIAACCVVESVDRKEWN